VHVARQDVGEESLLEGRASGLEGEAAIAVADVEQHAALVGLADLLADLLGR
jgi:hypothetical protein